MVKICKTALFAMAVAVVGCTTTTVDDGSGRTTHGSPSEVVEWMDDVLSEYYLYNDEYNSMDIYYDKEWDEFLDYHLMGMETNVFDKKRGSDGGYSIYSYVYRTPSSLSMSRSLEQSEAGFGLINFVVSGYHDCLGVLGVYPGSPAYEAGIRRGDIITSIDGRPITSANIFVYADKLLYPTVGDSCDIEIDEKGEKSLTCEMIAPNPVLHSEIIDGNTGYMVYAQFNSHFDSQFKEVLRGFSNVDNLILDLRLNGGGYNSSAVALASAIRGGTSAREVFAEYVFNDDLTGRYPKYDYFNSNAGILTLPEKRVYCLVSSATASASELVISALEGIGYDMVLIGETTEGKNVGMFIQDETIDGYEYTLAPITFISKNAAGFYEYQNGFEPDYAIEEFNDFKDFGRDEPLVAAALYHIENERFPAVSISRSAKGFDAQEIIGRSYPRGVLRDME